MKNKFLVLLLFSIVIQEFLFVTATDSTELPIINWPTFVIVGRPFTVSGKVPGARLTVKAKIIGTGYYEGQDCVVSTKSDTAGKFTLTLDMPYPYYNFERKVDAATGNKYFPLTIEWGNDEITEWINYKTLADYTFVQAEVNWPDSIIIGVPFTVTGTTPIPQVPVRVRVIGSGIDSGNDYVKEVMSNKAGSFTIIATIPRNWHFIALDKKVLVLLEWGYYPVEPYAASQKYVPFEYSGASGYDDGDTGGGGSDTGSGGGGGAVVAPPKPKPDEKIVKIIKTLYDSLKIRDKERLTEITMNKFKARETEWANIHKKMRK